MAVVFSAQFLRLLYFHLFLTSLKHARKYVLQKEGNLAAKPAQIALLRFGKLLKMNFHVYLLAAPIVQSESHKAIGPTIIITNRNAFEADFLYFSRGLAKLNLLKLSKGDVTNF